MIQVTNARRASSSSVAFRRDSGAGSGEGAETWGSWYNDKHYSLEVIQHPIRARMCGFGDKDRRPLAPAAVAKMIVRREDEAIVDVDDIDVAFFIVTVDLWSADGKQEMNLVLHPSSADRYIPTHVSKPRRRGNGHGSGSSAVDSQSSQPSLQALPPPAAAYANAHAQYYYQHGFPGYPVQPPPPPGMPDPNTAAGPNSVPMYSAPYAPYPHYPDHGPWSYPAYPPYQYPGYPGYPGSLPPIQSFHSRMPTPVQAPAPWSSDPARSGEPSAHPASSTESESPGSSPPTSSTATHPPAPCQVSGTANFYGPPPPVDGGPLYAMQPYGPPPPVHYPYAPPPPPAPMPPPTPVAHHSQSHSQPQPPPSSSGTSASRSNQNSSTYKTSGGGNANSNVSPSSPSASSVPLPRHSYTRTLVGPLSANAARLNDEHRKPGIFFLFQDLSIRTEGTFRLRLRLMNVGAHPAPEPGANRVMTDVAPILAQTFTEAFTVYSAKRFPGVPDTTALSIAFGNQGQKLPLRNRHGSRHQAGRRRARDESESDSDGQ